MKAIIVIMIMFLSTCLIIGQIPSKEAKNEAEFLQLLNQAKVVETKNKVAIAEADNKTNKMIDKTAKQIVSLKQEVKQLKTELNEANKKLDSISNPDANIKFELLPVSSGKENW